MFTGVRRLLFHPVVRYDYFMQCPCVLRISQLDSHFLCRLLIGYSDLQDFWSNDLQSHSEVFLDGLYCEF